MMNEDYKEKFFNHFRDALISLLKAEEVMFSDASFGTEFKNWHKCHGEVEDLANQVQEVLERINNGY